MIAVYCDVMGKRVIVGLESLERLAGDDGCVEVSYRCLCGRGGRMLTGRDRVSGELSGHLSV